MKTFLQRLSTLNNNTLGKKLFTVMFIFSGLILSNTVQFNSVAFAQAISDYKQGERIPKPVSRYHYYMQQRAYPNADIPMGAVANGFEEKELMMAKLSKNRNYIQNLQNAWRPVGPDNIGGRVKSIALHPNDDNIIYIGAAAGGVWKSIDGGETWKPLLDFHNSIAFGSISIDENNPETLYIGTGEAVSGGGNIYAGNGILKSTNGGETWFQIGLTTVGAFSKVFCHPKNSNLIIAGGFGRSGGLYISNDAGNTWDRKVQGSITDVSINLNNENEILCAINGVDILLSNNKGETWSSIKRGDLANNAIGRISVQFAPSNTNTIYLLTEMGSDRLGKAYKSTNKGQNWFKVHDGNAAFFNGQGFYDNYVAVNPSDENHALIGGIDTWLTTNGSQFANQTQGYNGGNTHVDHHCATYSKKNPKIVYLGTDGGVYRSTNGGATWTAKNNGLAISQFYGLGIDTKQPNRNVGGTQDNGTLGDLLGGAWRLLAGGDGFQVVVDSEKEFFLGESQYGNIFKVTYKAGNYGFEPFRQGLTPAESGYSLFDSPLIEDANYKGYYWHGRKSLYLNYGTGSWVEFAQTRIPTENVFYSAVAVSHGIEDLVYGGTNNGAVYVSQNGLEEPFVAVQGNGLVNRFVSSIKTSYTEPKTAYIAYSGYGTPHVFKTTDAGKSWRNVSGNLPNVPVNEIEIDPENPTHIYAATDVGVFVTYDDGKLWFPFGRSLPNSPAIALEFHNDLTVNSNRILRVATHGRSIWEIDLPTKLVSEYTLATPVGGESYVSGTNAMISWYGFTPPVKIEFSSNNGDTWILVSPEQGVVGNIFYMNIMNRPTFTARIKVTSIADPSQERISNTFTIETKQRGSLLLENTVNNVPYGIDLDDKGFLWATDFYGGNLIKLDTKTFEVVQSFKMRGDSLYTDISVDDASNTIYVQRLNSTAGGGGVIEAYDFSGKFLRQFNSPARSYPIGLEMINNILYVGDRDDQRQVRGVNPQNGSIFATYKSPCDVNFGPRGITFDGESLLQVCTNFSSGSLSDATLIKIGMDNLTIPKDNIVLEGYSGVINARGAAFDPSDKNIWVSDFGGNIYKVAGFDVIASVENDNFNNTNSQNNTYNFELYPNPAVNFSNFNYISQVDGFTKIQITNNLGEVIGTIFEENLRTNEVKNAILDTSNLTNGLYFVNLVVNNKVVSSTKLVVIR